MTANLTVLLPESSPIVFQKIRGKINFGLCCRKTHEDLVGWYVFRDAVLKSLSSLICPVQNESTDSPRYEHLYSNRTDVFVFRSFPDKELNGTAL